MKDIEIINVDLSNISEYGIFCVRNPKHQGYQAKLKWLKKRFSEGLKLKLLYLHSSGPVGFIEYVPGEKTWRGVEAKGYMVIHCIWVGGSHQGKGYGSRLLEECIKDAKKEKKHGVVMVTREGGWLSGKKLFLKNNSELVKRDSPFCLMVKKFKKNAPTPDFKGEQKKKLKKYKELTLIYASQCPFLAKSIRELTSASKEKGIKLNIIELKKPAQSQNAPSPYGVFNLVYKGRLLADHYISKRRFQYIMNEELK
ncbi:MAG: hypothetical protein AMJ90_01040 [candidate division Zixibacteria bacterium SM23_73_2]|nr:MAG: hypothetical protein AMJ90_01040 [candidate division Zixibacteria bacterium SM23_73_2]